jgi:hypothetical protein
MLRIATLHIDFIKALLAFKIPYGFMVHVEM